MNTATNSASGYLQYMFQYARCLSINKLQIRASLRASDELVVLYDHMSGIDVQYLALDGIHAT